MVLNELATGETTLPYSREFPLQMWKIVKIPKRHRFAALTAVIAGAVLQACTTTPGQRPSPDPNPIIATPNPRPDSSADKTFPNVFQAGTLIYDFTTSSTVQSIAGDSVPRTDTTKATALISVTFTPGSDAQVVQALVLIDSGQVLRQRVLQQDTLGPYTITVVPRQAVRISRPAVQPCSLEQPQLLTGDEVLPALPVGSVLPPRWADTTQYDLCRGGISFRVTRVAEYQPQGALGALDDDSLVVIRSTQVSLEGRGVQWQQPVEATGRGVSTDTLTIARQRLVEIDGATNVEITFRSQFRTQTFRQNSQTTMRARL